MFCPFPLLFFFFFLILIIFVLLSPSSLRNNHLLCQISTAGVLTVTSVSSNASFILLGEEKGVLFLSAFEAPRRFCLRFVELIRSTGKSHELNSLLKIWRALQKSANRRSSETKLWEEEREPSTATVPLTGFAKIR